MARDGWFPEVEWCGDVYKAGVRRYINGVDYGSYVAEYLPTASNHSHKAATFIARSMAIQLPRCVGALGNGATRPPMLLSNGAIGQS